MILPGLIGVFVGAPLVARELESGTFRFAWTQSPQPGPVDRHQARPARGVLLTALALAFSALFTWWYGPFDAITGRMSPYGAYEISGLVFAARTLFGFTLGALLGLLIRRTVPAMAATAAVWAAVVVPSMTLAAATDPETDHHHRPPGQRAHRRQPRALQRQCGQRLDPGRTPATTSASTSSSSRPSPATAAPPVPGPVSGLSGDAPLQPMGLLPAEQLVLALPDHRGLRLRHPRHPAGRRHRADPAPPSRLNWAGLARAWPGLAWCGLRPGALLRGDVDDREDVAGVVGRPVRSEQDRVADAVVVEPLSRSTWKVNVLGRSGQIRSASPCRR